MKKAPLFAKHSCLLPQRFTCTSNTPSVSRLVASFAARCQMLHNSKVNFYLYFQHLYLYFHFCLRPWGSMPTLMALNSRIGGLLSDFRFLLILSG